MFATGPQAGTAALNVAVPVGSLALAGNLFGVGSMLYGMVAAFFKSNVTQELWALPVADPSAGTFASGEISFAGSAVTGSGVFSLYIAGQLVQWTVYSTDAAETIAANCVAAANAIPGLYVLTAALEATNSPDVVFTCKWKGLTGNDITLIVNYLGLYGGQVTPAGVVYTIEPMAGGTGEPNFVNAISAIQTQEFDYVAMPYTDTASMDSWNVEYGFSSGGRWNYVRQQYGFIVRYLPRRLCRCAGMGSRAEFAGHVDHGH